MRHLVLCRPDEYNTITPALRDELVADARRGRRTTTRCRVVLLRAEGPAFCAGYGLDWSTAAQADRGAAREPRLGLGRRPADDRPVRGRRARSSHTIAKPTIAAVQGWCIAGGTDMVLNADLIVRGESARVRLPAGARVGDPGSAVGVGRTASASSSAKRYLFTGDEITGGRSGTARARARVRRPTTTARRARDARSRTGSRACRSTSSRCSSGRSTTPPRRCRARHVAACSARLFDGVARHTQEGLDFVARARSTSASARPCASATTRSATTAAAPAPEPTATALWSRVRPIGTLLPLAAGWSSLVARRAHNPKVVGSNPTPATIETARSAGQRPSLRWGPLVVQRDL